MFHIPLLHFKTLHSNVVRSTKAFRGFFSREVFRSEISQDFFSLEIGLYCSFSMQKSSPGRVCVFDSDLNFIGYLMYQDVVFKWLVHLTAVLKAVISRRGLTPDFRPTSP